MRLTSTVSGIRLCRHVTTAVFLQTCHSISEKTAIYRTLQGCVITSTVGQDVEIDSKETFKLHVYYPNMLLLAEVKLSSSFSQRLHERVRLELNRLNGMYSRQFLFSPDS